MEPILPSLQLLEKNLPMISERDNKHDKFCEDITCLIDQITQTAHLTPSLPGQKRVPSGPIVPIFPRFDLSGPSLPGIKKTQSQFIENIQNELEASEGSDHSFKSDKSQSSKLIKGDATQQAEQIDISFDLPTRVFSEKADTIQIPSGDIQDEDQSIIANTLNIADFLQPAEQLHNIQNIEKDIENQQNDHSNTKIIQEIQNQEQPEQLQQINQEQPVLPCFPRQLQIEVQTPVHEVSETYVSQEQPKSAKIKIISRISEQITPPSPCITATQLVQVQQFLQSAEVYQNAYEIEIASNYQKAREALEQGNQSEAVGYLFQRRRIINGLVKLNVRVEELEKAVKKYWGKEIEQLRNE